MPKRILAEGASWFCSDGAGKLSEQLAAEGYPGSAEAIGEQSEVTDAHECLGQNMQEEATQELASAELHVTVLATVGVVLPAKSDVLVIEGQQSMIGNGHAMGVPPKIVQHLHRATEGWLGIDDPILTVQATQQLRKLSRISERGGRTGTMKYLAAVQAFQSRQKFPAKDAAENLHGEEERRARTDPTTVVRR